MADTKISGLTSATTPLDGTEVVPIVQSSTTKKVANNDLRPKQIQSNATSGVLQITGPAAASTRVMTTPDANFTAARTDAGQTFSGLQNFSFSGGNGPVVNRTDGAGYINFQTAGTNNAQIGEDGIGGFTIYTNLAGSYKQPMIWRADGNVSLLAGNLIQGVSGKGIDYSANTPAAGMTSQLLNWYEEGTWTPTVGSTAGTITTVGATVGRYVRIGRQVYLSWQVTITTNGTGTGALTITGIPFSASTALAYYGGGGYIINTGKGLTQALIAAGGTIYARVADGTYPGADGEIIVGSINYQV
jgi:hypothetical protein